MVPLCTRWLARNPYLPLEVRLSDRWTPLVEEAVDVAVHTGPVADSRLVARALGEQRLVVVASPAYLAQSGTPRRPGDLAAHEGIAFRMPTSGPPRPWQLQQSGRPVEIRPRERLVVDEAEALVRAAEAGSGIAQVPDDMAAAAPARGTLVTLLPGFAPARIPVSAVYPYARQVSPKVRAFVDRMVEHADTLQGAVDPSPASRTAAPGGRHRVHGRRRRACASAARVTCRGSSAPRRPPA